MDDVDVLRRALRSAFGVPVDLGIERVRRAFARASAAPGGGHPGRAGGHRKSRAEVLEVLESNWRLRHAFAAEHGGRAFVVERPGGGGWYGPRVMMNSAAEPYVPSPDIRAAYHLD